MNGKASATHGTAPVPTDRLTYRLPEAGHLLGGISRNSVKRLIAAGELEIVPVGHYVQVTRESIHAFVERRKQKKRAA